MMSEDIKEIYLIMLCEELEDQFKVLRAKHKIGVIKMLQTLNAQKTDA